MNIVAFLGSMRQERRGIRAERYVERRLTERGHSVTVIDPMEVRLPLLGPNVQGVSEGVGPGWRPVLRGS